MLRFTGRFHITSAGPSKISFGYVFLTIESIDYSLEFGAPPQPKYSTIQCPLWVELFLRIWIAVLVISINIRNS